MTDLKLAMKKDSTSQLSDLQKAIFTDTGHIPDDISPKLKNAYANYQTEKNSHILTDVGGALRGALPLVNIPGHLKEDVPLGAKVMNVGSDIINTASTFAGGPISIGARLTLGSILGASFADMAQQPGNQVTKKLRDWAEEHPYQSASINLATSIAGAIPQAGNISSKIMETPGDIADAASSLEYTLKNIVTKPMTDAELAQATRNYWYVANDAKIPTGSPGEKFAQVIPTGSVDPAFDALITKHIVSAGNELKAADQLGSMGIMPNIRTALREENPVGYIPSYDKFKFSGDLNKLPGEAFKNTAAVSHVVADVAPQVNSASNVLTDPANEMQYTGSLIGGLSGLVPSQHLLQNYLNKSLFNEHIAGGK